jgi:hypothetical protein
MTWLTTILRRFRPARSNEADELRGLLAILDRACALRPDADQVVRACGASDDVPGDVGHTGGELVGEYHRLRQELRELRVDDTIRPIAEELARLLEYHQWLVRAALQLAFSISDNPRRELMRRRLDGPGPPGERLARLRASVADQLATAAREAVR